MKLGKLQKQLSMLLIASMLSCPILATEVVEEEQVTSTTQVEEENVLDGQEEEMQFMRQYGNKVNKSVVKDNIKVTVEYILADSYTVKVLFSIEKLDKKPFKTQDGLFIQHVELISKKKKEKEEKIKALLENATFEERLKIMAEFDEGLKQFIKEDNTVDTEGYIAYLQDTSNIIGYESGRGSACYGMYDTKENTDSKVYFTYESRDGEPILDERIMSIATIIEEEEKSEDITIDLVSYLTKHKQDALITKANNIDEHERAYLKELKQTNKEEYLREKKYLEERPKTLLAKKGLALPFIKGEEKFTIDNIGFIEGKLHILILGEGENKYNLEVYDQTGDWIIGSYNTGSTSTLEDGTIENKEYCVYDIGSVEELKKYTLKVRSTKTVEEWQGPWEINLDRSTITPSNIIKVDQMIPYMVDENAHLSEVHIGKGSIALVMDEIESKINNEHIHIKIKLKDGTERDLNYSNAYNREKDKMILVYHLNDIVGEDIKSIQIDEKTISLY